MFGDLQSRLGPIEHLPLLNPRDHRRRQPGEAMATRLRLMPFDDIGLCDRLQRAPGMSRLPAAPLARLAAQAAGHARRLRQAVARRRLAAVRAVLVQSTLKVRDLLAQGRVLRPQILNLPLQRGDQIPNLGLENYPYLDSYLPAPRPKKSHPSRTSVKPVANETHPTLAVTRFVKNHYIFDQITRLCTFRHRDSPPASVLCSFFVVPFYIAHAIHATVLFGRIESIPFVSYRLMVTFPSSSMSVRAAMRSFLE